MKQMLLCLAIPMLVISCASETPNFPDANFADSIAIAPLDEALTFARVDSGTGMEVLAVGSYSNDRVVAFNLTKALGPEFTDPIVLFQKLGYDGLQSAIADGLAASPVEVSVDQLTLPVDLTDAHVAAGTNFAAHADESAVEDGPFLFAKLVAPTPFNSSVQAGEALLDYEVELAFVALSDCALPDVPPFMGLILANDFTDRATLLRHVNPDDVTSGDGFTTGKSAEGFLPVGNLFVIPRELDTFVSDVELKLAVNGKLRQHASMTLAIWDIHELLRQSQANQNVLWDHRGETVALPVSNGVLPARTMIVSGTPAGTVFQGISNGNIAAGLGAWIGGGWGESITHHTIETYIDSAREDGNFLQPGDEVSIHVDRLGAINSSIEE